MKTLFVVLILTIALLIMAGCSSGNINTVQPSADLSISNPMLDLNIPIAEIGENPTDRTLLDMGIIEFDPGNLKATVTSDRMLTKHYNGSYSIPPPEIIIRSFNPMLGIIELDVTIKNENPFAVNGYDVRLIVFTDNAGVNLLNGDDWTSLWDKPGGAMINPFKAYAKLEPNRIFSVGSKHTERLQIYLPGGSLKISFAIDACWPSNCDEPYLIEDFSQTKLKDVMGSQASVQVKVYDWQEDVTEVSLYCPSITGTLLVPFEKVDSTKWHMNLVNNLSAPAGEYTGVILAKSNDPLYLYDIVKISVSEVMVAKWTIFYYVYEENLYSFRTNLNEMEVVGSVDGVMNIVCLWDKPDTPYDSILEIHKDPGGYNDTIISPEVEDNGEVIPPEGLDMHDPETLRRFLTWGIREYPSENYGMTLLSHGNGGVYGFPPEKSFFDDMGVWEFNAAARDALDEHNLDRLEFVGLESCTMSFLETAYALRGCTKVAWSSEYLMYVSSAQYDQVLAYFLEHMDEMDGHDFASLFIHNALDTGGAVTYAAWDSDLTESVVIPALNVFAQKLIDYLPTYRTEIEACRFSSDDWGSECTDPRITDLGYFIQNIMNYNPPLPDELTSSALNLWNAIRTAVYDYDVIGSGSGCYGSATGWEILFTDQFDNPDPIYQTVREQINLTGLGTDSLWDEFLSAYDDEN